MGDMADDAIRQMELGQSVVLDIENNKEIIVDNMDLMYSGAYDDKNKYKVLRDYYEEDDC